MLNMAMNPEVLVLDEPTSGLDAIAKADLLDHIVTKVEYGEFAMVISTHHLYELEKICDTVTMLGETGVKYQGNLDEVKAQISKYQVVYKNGVPEGVLDDRRIISYSNIGSVYTFLWDHVLDEEQEGAEEFFGGKGADLVEQTEISLEELFIYSNRRRRDHE